VSSAIHRLAECGYRPTVAVADGVEGYPAAAPYDRIIATCSVRRIPDAWLDQLRPGGVLVTPLAGGRFEYGLVRLLSQPDGSFVGRLRFQGVSFMPLRRAGQPPSPSPQAARALIESTEGGDTRSCSLPTALAYRSTASWGLMFMIGAAGQDLAWCWRGPGHEWGEYNSEQRREFPALVSWHDRSWAIVSRSGEGKLEVTQGGPRRLWDIVEGCDALFSTEGEPTHARYGITITRDRRQWLWLDCPESGHSWEL
jgi:hypothetical protein